jgi:hypothetical protein
VVCWRGSIASCSPASARMRRSRWSGFQCTGVSMARAISALIDRELTSVFGDSGSDESRRGRGEAAAPMGRAATTGGDRATRTGAASRGRRRSWRLGQGMPVQRLAATIDAPADQASTTSTAMASPAVSPSWLSATVDGWSVVANRPWLSDRGPHTIGRSASAGRCRPVGLDLIVWRAHVGRRAGFTFE